MKNFIKNAVVFAAFLFTFLSCATTPVVEVSQPWTRSLGSLNSIDDGSSFYIDVNGQKNHLLINNSLLDEKLYENVASQLSRRGFDVTRNAEMADQQLKIDFTTREVQVMSVQMASFQNSRQFNYSGASAGILAASTVGAQALKSSMNTESKTSSQTAYRHTIGLSILGENNELVWTGESTWTGKSIDIRSRFNTASQILLSNFPGYGKIIPRVPAVNPEKEENYFRLYVEDRYFVGPALPYAINFDITSETRRLIRDPSYNISGLDDAKISAAVIDLIETAEYAVPRDPDYENPLSIKQWNRVYLGGTYYIGNNNQPTNILVELRGSDYGYTIRSAKEAERQEYTEFQENLSQWREALIRYYDVFE